jgi:Tol biopolymer transport system component
VKNLRCMGIAAALIFFAAVYVLAQLPKDPEERAKAIAQMMAANASQLTLFDREGKQLSTVGGKELQNQPAFSPDGRRLALLKPDLEKENNDIWVVDVTTGRSIPVTSSPKGEASNQPVWSPDGSRIAYVGLRGGAFGIYQKPADGTGAEELILKTNAPPTLSHWSVDGKYICYSVSDLSGGALYAVPLAGERKPIEIFRSKSQIALPRLSPDDRFVSYMSNETGKNEVYVRPFNPNAAPATAVWKISDEGGGNARWRRDGKELYYFAADRGIMAVSVSTSPDFEFEKPRLMFRPSAEIGAAPADITSDGNRIVIAVPPPALRQLTVFDRQGKVVTKVGPPGNYVQPNFSPDGKNIVVMRTDPQKGGVDIWTYDVATGKGTAVTNDDFPENAPIWSPDGKSVAYVSTRQSYASIYRKAADGTGDEEQLFRYTPGAGMVLTDWSPDGKFLTFYTGVLLLVPIDPNVKPLDRKAIEWLREDYDVAQGRFSPDQRYIAFLSNEGESDVSTLQVWVRPFDSVKPDAPAPGKAIKISNNKGGAAGMIFWRQDGRELLYMTRDWEIMSVDVTTTPSFQAGTPKLLFKIPGPLQGNPAQWKNITPDGQRFVFSMPTR